MPHWLIATLICFLAIPSGSLAHSGGIDKYDCHHNRKKGGYDCHHGPLPGRVFESRRQMLDAMGGLKGTQSSEACVREKGSGPELCGDIIAR
jgi:hypothetical protein